MSDELVPQETVESLRIPNSVWEQIPVGSRQIIAEVGIRGMRQTAAVLRDATTIQRSIRDMRKLESENAQVEMGVIDVDSTDRTDEVASLSDEVDALRAEYAELQERLERSEAERGRLTAELAKSAMAVHGEGSQR